MSQVSKKFIDKNVEKRMFEVLWKTIARLKRPTDAAQFLKDILGPTEQIMIAKRLAIAVLLSKGYGYSDISKILKVSYATISKVVIWLKLGGDGLKKAIRKIVAEEALKEFLHDVEDAIFTSHAHPDVRARLKWEANKAKRKRRAGII